MNVAAVSKGGASRRFIYEHPTHLLYDALSRPDMFSRSGLTPVSEKCELCGSGSHPRVATNDALGDRFFDRWLFSGTGAICAACMAYFERAGKGRTYRTTSLVVTPDRIEQAPALTHDRLRSVCDGTDTPRPPFFVTVTTTYKKHLVPQARIAFTDLLFPVRFEQQTVMVEPNRFRRIADRIECLRKEGFTVNEISTGRPSLRKVSTPRLIALWRETEQEYEFGGSRRSGLFRLALFLVRPKL